MALSLPLNVRRTSFVVVDDALLMRRHCCVHFFVGSWFVSSLVSLIEQDIWRRPALD